MMLQKKTSWMQNINNLLFNLISNQLNIDKIYLYVKDPY